MLDVADEQPEGVIFVIPARLKQCEVPQRLTQWQYVDLWKSGGYSRLMSALLTAAERNRDLQSAPGSC